MDNCEPVIFLTDSLSKGPEDFKLLDDIMLHLRKD